MGLETGGARAGTKGECEQLWARRGRWRAGGHLGEERLGSGRSAQQTAGGGRWLPTRALRSPRPCMPQRWAQGLQALYFRLRRLRARSNRRGRAALLPRSLR